MDKEHWTRRIMEEMRRRTSLQPGLVVLSELAISMLGESDSREGLAWLTAVHELQERGWLRVDDAGYIVLTAQIGLESCPTDGVTHGRPVKMSQSDLATRRVDQSRPKQALSSSRNGGRVPKSCPRCRSSMLLEYQDVFERAERVFRCLACGHEVPADAGQGIAVTPSVGPSPVA